MEMVKSSPMHQMQTIFREIQAYSFALWLVKLQLSFTQKLWWSLKYRHHTYFIERDFFSFESINSADNSVVIWKKFFSLLDVSESDKDYTPQVAVKKEEEKYVKSYIFLWVVFNSLFQEAKPVASCREVLSNMCNAGQGTWKNNTGIQTANINKANIIIKKPQPMWECK